MNQLSQDFSQQGIITLNRRVVARKDQLSFGRSRLSRKQLGSYCQTHLSGASFGIGSVLADDEPYPPTYGVSPIAKNQQQRKSILNRYRLLMVEDDLLTQWAAEQRFRKLGYQLKVVATLQMALSLVQKNQYDLILIDMRLPDGNGQDLVKAIRNNREAINYHTPIIGLSATVNRMDREAYYAIGMAECLEKPLTEKSILMIIKRYLSHTVVTSYKERFQANVLPILNIAMCARTIKSERIRHGGISKQWTKGLFEEYQRLKQAWEDRRWRQLKVSARELHRSATYCKMFHLQACCAALESALTDSDAITSERLLALYRQLLQEIDMVLEEQHLA